MIILKRNEFFFLHQAIVQRAEQNLLKNSGQGLNRINAQFFYGFQAGKKNVHSINFMLQKSLKKQNYDFRNFRNYSINGRRLNDNVKAFNDGREEIEVNKVYLDAYLNFLGIFSVKSIVQEKLTIPDKIEIGNTAFHLNSSKIKKQWNMKWLLIGLPISLFFFLMYLIYSSFFASLNENKILSPIDHQIIDRSTIICKGTLGKLPKDLVAVLVVERDSLDEQGEVVQKKYWPKSHFPIALKNWQVSIFEDHLKGEQEYSDLFAISLYAVDSSSYKILQDWHRESKKTGNYIPFNGILGFPLDRVENLRFQDTSKPKEVLESVLTKG